jgi:hypothetical protein
MLALPVVAEPAPAPPGPPGGADASLLGLGTQMMSEVAAGVLLGLVHDGTPGRTGVYSGTANAPAGLLDAAAAGNVYYNIHSAAPDGVPGGEVRGQLVPVP